MIVDHRIYITIYLLLLLPYLASLMVPQKWFNRVWGASLGVFFCVLIANALDWLWS